MRTIPVAPIVCSAGLGLVLCLSVLSTTAAESKPVDYIHQVQPILRESCYSCHGAEKKRGGLRLDVRAFALKGGEGGVVIVPGHSDQSSLLQRLITSDPDERMPQKADALSAEKIEIIRAWIDEGAPWPEAVAGTGIDPANHWAFKPLQITVPPVVEDTRWVRNPIDQFVLAKLEAKGIRPNPTTDKRLLVRRAYFDLIGLPPTPEQVDAFVGDESADAYLKLIDTLLASPHYGERWARHWLDTARFGESHGFEQDYDRPFAYWYRDFVIKALNEDMPFDQFIRWQLAGDEFDPENPWALAATGFVGAGVFPTQLTEAEFEPARYDELDNMASTTSSAMLGLTLGCARCHDHKFDPISSKEYYRFIATFATTIRSEVPLDFDPEKYRTAKAAFDHAHAPLLAARDEWEKNQLPARFERWLRQAPSESLARPAWMTLDLNELQSKGGATLSQLGDGSVLASGKNPDHDTFLLTAQTHLTNLAAIRVEALADPSLPKGGPGRADNGNFQFTELQVRATPLHGTGEPVEYKLVNPRATFEQSADLSAAKVIDDNAKTGWAIDPQFGTNHTAVFEFASPATFPGGTKLAITLGFNGNTRHAIGHFRLAIAPALTDSWTAEGIPQSVAEVFASLPPGANLGETLNDAQRLMLQRYYRTMDSDWRRLDTAVQDHLRNEPKPDLKKVMITSEGVKPIPHHADERGFPHFYAKTYFLKRGDPRQKGDEMTPGYLKILTRASDGDHCWQQPPPAGCRTSWRRRALAQWITDPVQGAGDLLARVAVNRLWQHHFGKGIVATPNDFGTQGARPSHPELLDWLARDLQQHQWNLKRIHKLMMTSATYLQTIDRDPLREKVDPDNQLLWRRDRTRLEAEAIRDSLLYVSGILDQRLFGPGTMDESMRRRSIYFFIKRSQFIPILQLFDAPDPSVSVGSRVPTTVAPQALLFMNNDQVRACARALAARLRAACGTEAELIVNQAYQLALGRQPDAAELASSAAFLAQQTDSYRATHPADAPALALADFSQALLGLNEFIYVE